jgi:putative flippase GtrA
MIKWMKIIDAHKENISQLIRYFFVGLCLNLAGFLVYLLVTSHGMDPKLAVTILYPLAIFFGYFTHRKFSFLHAGGMPNITSLGRYFIVYIVGYGLNITLLYLLHDRLGFSHQWVQAASIFIIASFLFIALRLFVFRGAIR